MNEAVRRIVGQHWALIVFFVLVCVVAAALFQRGEAETYTATTRFVLDTDDPESRAESAAIADTANAIATSPSRVRDALASAGVRGRDATEIAEEHVSVRALGSSGVLELSVSDPDAQVAAAISNALADELIEARLAVTGGGLDRVLADLDSRIAELTQSISTLDAGIDSLTVRMANAPTAAQANALRATRDSRARERDFLAQQRSLLESERITLLSTDALRAQPSIIGRASVPDRADASGRGPVIGLGIVLGLILGVGSAALIESFRPTLVGGDAVAREFRTPLLGTLSADGHDDEALEKIAGRVALAAEAAGARTVTLVPVADEVDVGRLAERMAATLEQNERHAARTREAVGGGGRGSGAVAFDVPRVVEFHDRPAANAARTGVVLVSPTTIRKSDVDATRHLLSVANFTVLGLLAYPASRPRRRWLRSATTRS